MFVNQVLDLGIEDAGCFLKPCGVAERAYLLEGVHAEIAKSAFLGLQVVNPKPSTLNPKSKKVKRLQSKSLISASGPCLERSDLGRAWLVQLDHEPPREPKTP